MIPSMGLRGTIRHALHRLRHRRAKQQAVREFERSLALFVDLEALEASVAARIKELFDPDRLVILLLDRASASYLPAFYFGLARCDLDGVTLALHGRLARWFLVNENCLVPSRDRGVLEYLDAAEQKVLRRLKVALCAPLLSQNHLTGMILLGSDQPDWQLSRNDAELLQHLANQAGLAFRNAVLYREQRQRLDRLHRAERLAAVGQLAAGVAHEVRNPLTAIRSTMQYLGQGFAAKDPKHDLVAELIDEVDRINSTISSLLSLSRAGDLRVAEIDPVELLDETLQLVEIQARKQDVEIKRRYSAHHREPRFQVMGDAGQLKQVFLNLILNAIQAMPEGGRITVTADRWHPAQSPQAKDWIHIQIADTGPGIAPEQLRTVFDPFFTTKSEGTGLGLAICHRIVEQHEGEIELLSTEGEGATASIRLPLVE